jgi:hypothetical protein
MNTFPLNLSDWTKCRLTKEIHAIHFIWLHSTIVEWMYIIIVRTNFHLLYSSSTRLFIVQWSALSIDDCLNYLTWDNSTLTSCQIVRSKWQYSLVSLKYVIKLQQWNNQSYVQLVNHFRTITIKRWNVMFVGLISDEMHRFRSVVSFFLFSCFVSPMKIHRRYSDVFWSWQSCSLSPLIRTVSEWITNDCWKNIESHCRAYWTYSIFVGYRYW